MMTVVKMVINLTMTAKHPDTQRMNQTLKITQRREKIPQQMKQMTKMKIRKRRR